MAALFLSLSLAGVAAAQDNTSLGTGALFSNTTGALNTASGVNALLSNTVGDSTRRDENQQSSCRVGLVCAAVRQAIGGLGAL